ncbi:MAG: hypothetical protein FWG77_04080 [Treponema sp.]|nr:hypothetical protein [Treponema sp.]
MKVVIVIIPAKSPGGVKAITYPVDGNKAIEYNKPVRCPINGVLARTMKKDEEVRIIYILAKGENSKCEQNKRIFLQELEEINAGIGAKLEYDEIETSFEPTKRTINKFLLDLTEKIPGEAEVYADITYGYKPESLALLCAIRFAEEFRNVNIEYIIYGKAEFIAKGEIINPKIFDISALYYLFKMLGSMGTTDDETASNILKKFLVM